jgi:DNA-binding NarL/FixJ family response regulator
VRRVAGGGTALDPEVIAQRLVITERAVAKHTASIFLRLGLQPSDDDNRRVLAVVTYLSRSNTAP